MKCPKCSGEMKVGITKGTGIIMLMAKMFWTSKVKFWGLTDPDLKYIKTWRCIDCGYLENYAK